MNSRFSKAKILNLRFRKAKIVKSRFWLTERLWGPKILNSRWLNSRFWKAKNPKFKTLADFKILLSQNPDFKILAKFNILAPFNILESKLQRSRFLLT